MRSFVGEQRIGPPVTTGILNHEVANATPSFKGYSNYGHG